MKKDCQPELWKPIVGYEGLYEISNKGGIRSLDHYTKALVGRKASALRSVFRKGKVLVPTPRNKHGHQVISLSKNGVVKRRQIHILVLEAFVGPCPPGLECRHLNGNAADNNWPENICWGTKKQNAQDKKLHGKNKGQPPGSAHSLATLTEEQVLIIYDLFHSGVKAADVAAQCHCSIPQVYNIGTKHNWKSLLEKERPGQLRKYDV